MTTTILIVTDLPDSAEKLTPAQVSSLASQAGMDPQLVEKLVRSGLPNETDEAFATREQLFNGFVNIRGQWRQANASDLQAIALECEQLEEQLGKAAERGRLIQNAIEIAAARKSPDADELPTSFPGAHDTPTNTQDDELTQQEVDANAEHQKQVERQRRDDERQRREDDERRDAIENESDSVIGQVPESDGARNEAMAQIAESDDPAESPSASASDAVSGDLPSDDATDVAETSGAQSDAEASDKPE